MCKKSSEKGRENVKGTRQRYIKRVHGGECLEPKTYWTMLTFAFLYLRSRNEINSKLRQYLQQAAPWRIWRAEPRGCHIARKLPFQLGKHPQRPLARATSCWTSVGLVPQTTRGLLEALAVAAFRTHLLPVIPPAETVNSRANMEKRIPRTEHSGCCCHRGKLTYTYEEHRSRMLLIPPSTKANSCVTMVRTKRMLLIPPSTKPDSRAAKGKEDPKH